MAANFVHEEGNLTRDPEVRTTPTGKAVLSFAIAQTQRKKNDAGQWEDGETSFFDVEFWPSDPAYWIKRLGKGTGVVIDGELKQDRWEDADKNVRSKIVIRATSIFSKWLNELTAAPAQADPPPF